jgi:transposase
LRIYLGPELPGVFPPEVRAQATALACSRPRHKGIPLIRWSAAEIARYLITLGTVACISASTVGRWLAQERIRPWCYHTWQHRIPRLSWSERGPFCGSMNERKPFSRRGWVVCTDEKTSIQARKREQPNVPAGPGHPVYVAPRYERKGALQLFAGLSVADGRIYGMCRNRKRFVDYQAFLLRVIIPEALRRGVHTLALILDNGPTHAPKQLEHWLAKETQARGWPLKIQVYWLPKNASWLDQIEIWFSILQRKLLKPNDFENLQVLEKAIRSFVRYCNRTAKPIHTSSLKPLPLVVVQLEVLPVKGYNRPL